MQARRHRADSASEATVHRRPVIRAVTAVLAIATISGVAQAEVLYDTTGMTDSNSYDSFGINVIGGAALLGFLIDDQTADDFDLARTYDITTVTADFVNFTSGGLAPAGGVLVEFFSDLGGLPGETPFAAVLASGVDVTASAFSDHTGNGQGVRLTVDLTGSGITLSTGTWWLSMTAVDETPVVGDLYAQVKLASLLLGHEFHFRDGGLDHGTGYPGLHGLPDWGPGSLVGEFGSVAMKIEGNPAADLDGDGIVGITDFLMLLGSWGACPNPCLPSCPADIDSDCDVGIADFLLLLGNWG